MLEILAQGPGSLRFSPQHTEPNKHINQHEDEDPPELAESGDEEDKSMSPLDSMDREDKCHVEDEHGQAHAMVGDEARPRCPWHRQAMVQPCCATTSWLHHG